MPGYVLVDVEALYMVVIVAGASGLLIGWSLATWLIDNEDRIYEQADKVKAAGKATIYWARAFFKRTGSHRLRRRPRGHLSVFRGGRA